LRNNPQTKLTSVDDFYFLRRDPLIILCDVSVDDRMVRVVTFIVAMRNKAGPEDGADFVRVCSRMVEKK